MLWRGLPCSPWCGCGCGLLGIFSDFLGLRWVTCVFILIMPWRGRTLNVKYIANVTDSVVKYLTFWNFDLVLSRALVEIDYIYYIDYINVNNNKKVWVLTGVLLLSGPSLGLSRVSGRRRCLLHTVRNKSAVSEQSVSSQWAVSEQSVSIQWALKEHSEHQNKSQYSQSL